MIPASDETVADVLKALRTSRRLSMNRLAVMGGEA